MEGLQQTNESLRSQLQAVERVGCGCRTCARLGRQNTSAELIFRSCVSSATRRLSPRASFLPSQRYGPLTPLPAAARPLRTDRGSGHLSDLLLAFRRQGRRADADQLVVWSQLLRVGERRVALRRSVEADSASVCSASSSGKVGLHFLSPLEITTDPPTSQQPSTSTPSSSRTSKAPTPEPTAPSVAALPCEKAKSASGVRILRL